ncbi:2-amino-4-hydroxy-6-hydroxymethyldihydropteridine diphosphokinase [bacterium]|nr:2-amino-4-hydroxy-6-hydroxymethyldihydropteridine diphosphokinase [bacterium]
MGPVFIGLGSNIGDRYKNLSDAIIALDSFPGNELCNISSVYETEPWGLKDQAGFLNMVCELQTTLSAVELLAACLSIERSLGRERHIKWGPRSIDIDILLMGYDIINNRNLQVPHPHLSERRFVLRPLVELAPDYVVPGLDRSLIVLLDCCTDTCAVTEFKAGDDLWPRPPMQKM